MHIFGCGRDTLTIWAVTRSLSLVLHGSHDPAGPSRRRICLRPSFGGGGGKGQLKQHADKVLRWPTAAKSCCKFTRTCGWLVQPPEIVHQHRVSGRLMPLSDSEWNGLAHLMIAAHSMDRVEQVMV